MKVKEALINAVLGVIGTMLIMLGTGLWGVKEGKTEHDKDVQMLEAQIRAATVNSQTQLDAAVQDIKATQREQTQRILDAFCVTKDAKRVCTTTQ